MAQTKCKTNETLVASTKTKLVGLKHTRHKFGPYELRSKVNY